MNTSELIIVRHGQTDHNHKGLLIGKSSCPLNSEGRKQAYRVAKFLNSKNIGKILSSPAPRATDTSQIISTHINIPFSVDSILRERDYGPFEGLDRADLIKKRKEYTKDNIDPTQNWSSIDCVESDEAIYKRVHPLISTFICEKTINTVWITHAGVIKSFLYSNFLIPRHKNLCFKIPNGAVIIFQLKQDNLELNGLIPNNILKDS